MFEHLVGAAMVLLILLQFAVLGGALAGGAWVVWRFLEGRYGGRRSANVSARPVGRWALIVVVLVCLVGFAFGPSAQPATAPAIPLQLIPFLVLSAVVAGIVWLVRQALR